MRVDFVVIGAQKSGTTSLAAQLAEHPEICISRIKEPGFFSGAADWQSNLAQYHQLFDPEEGPICGEASTMYTFLPESPATSSRLHAYNPDLKLIYIMRNPVDRVISHYSHNLVRGIEPRSPEKAVIEDGRYVNRSRYGVQIRPYLDFFGREQILLLVFEEYIANQYAILEQVANFLGVSRSGFEDVETTAQHKSVGVPYLKHESVAKFTQTDIFRSVRAIVPEELRHTVRHRLLSNKLEMTPEFGPELQESIWRLVADDVTMVEDLLGRSLRAWQRGPVS
jgi:hypothetical protein